MKVRVFNMEYELNSKAISNAIKRIAKEKGVSTGKMLLELGLSKNTLSTMQLGGYLPSLDTLVKISIYLDVSADYLLGRTDNPTIRDAGVVLSEVPLPPQVISNLSLENLRAVVEFAEHLASKQNS
jgi:transcriptional regulator with XRE-family HTH domain